MVLNGECMSLCVCVCLYDNFTIIKKKTWQKPGWSSFHTCSQIYTHARFVPQVLLHVNISWWQHVRMFAHSCSLLLCSVKEQSSFWRSGRSEMKTISANLHFLRVMNTGEVQDFNYTPRLNSVFSIYRTRQTNSKRGQTCGLRRKLSRISSWDKR